MKEGLSQLTGCHPHPIPDVSCTPGTPWSTDPRSVPRDLVPLCSAGTAQCFQQPHLLGMGQDHLDHLHVGSPMLPTPCPVCAGRDEPPLTQHPEFPQRVPAARNKSGDGTRIGHHILLPPGIRGREGLPPALRVLIQPPGMVHPAQSWGEGQLLLHNVGAELPQVLMGSGYFAWLPLGF